MHKQKFIYSTFFQERFLTKYVKSIEGNARNERK